MIGVVIGVLLTCLLLGLLWWAIMTVWPAIATYIADPFRTVAYVLLIVLMVLIVVYYVLLPLLGSAGIHVPILR